MLNKNRLTMLVLAAAVIVGVPSLVAAAVIIVPIPASEIRNRKVVAPADLTGIHRIALVAPVLDKVIVQRMGLGATLFGRGYSETGISDWKLTDVALEAAKSALGERFEFVHPDFGASDPFAAADPQPADDASHLLEGIVRTMPDHPEIDAYLVLWPSAEPFPGTSTFLYAAGVDRLPPIGKPRPESHYGEASIHLYYGAYLVRALDGRVIAAATGEQPHEKETLKTFFSTGVEVFPVAWSGRMSWSAKADAMTDDERQVLRDTLSDLVRKSVPYTLVHMGLAPPTP